MDLMTAAHLGIWRLDVGLELARRVTDHVDAEAAHDLARAAVVEHRRRRMIQHVDDLLRRAGRRHQPVPGGGVEPRCPSSSMVATAGSSALRATVATASARSRPARTWSATERRRREHHLHVTADDVLQGRPRLLVGDMDDVHLGLDLEQFAGEMGGAAVAGRREGQRGRAWPWRARSTAAASCAGKFGIDHQDVGLRAEQRDRGKSSCGSKPSFFWSAELVASMLVLPISSV